MHIHYRATLLVAFCSVAASAQNMPQPGPVMLLPTSDPILHAASFPGTDMGAKVNAAIAACNVNNPAAHGHHVVTGCTILIEPPSQGAAPYAVTTTIVPPSISYAPIRIECAAGAQLDYTGSGWLFDLNGNVNLLDTYIEHCVIFGNPNAAGGIRLGSGAGMHIQNNHIQFFGGMPLTGSATAKSATVTLSAAPPVSLVGRALSGFKGEIPINTIITAQTGATLTLSAPANATATSVSLTAGSAGILLNGTDTSSVQNNQFNENYDSIVMQKGTFSGYAPNSITIEGNHFSGDTHLPYNARLEGTSTRFINNTFDPPAPSALAIAGYFNGGTLLFANNYLEGTVQPGGTIGYGLILAGYQYRSIIENNYFGLTNVRAPILEDFTDTGGCFSVVRFTNNVSGGAEGIFVDQTLDCGGGGNGHGASGGLFEHNLSGNESIGPVLITDSGGNYSVSKSTPSNQPVLLFNDPWIHSSPQSISTEEAPNRGLVIPNLIAPTFRCHINDNSGKNTTWSNGSWGTDPQSFISCADGSFHGPVVGTVNGHTAETQNNKGTPNGYAPLDAAGKVPLANLPANQNTHGTSGQLDPRVAIFPANGLFSSTSYFNHIICTGGGTPTLADYFTGQQFTIVAAGTADCHIQAASNAAIFGNTKLSNRLNIPAGTSLKLVFDGTYFRVE